MKKVRILALHLAYGGIEKAIISTANLLADKYDVEIISVYNMPDSPAFRVDSRVCIRYLLDEIPNPKEWKAAVRAFKIVDIVKESVKSLRILRNKKRAVIDTLKSIHDGVLITTRHEDNLVLSKYGDKNVLKIAQLHHDHNFIKKYTDGFINGYGNIDVFTLLTPSLVDEVREIMRDNRHTRLALMPNFLETYPDVTDLGGREETILAVGRLEPVKGFDRLIRCFRDIHRKRPACKLKIVGEGTERKRLEEMIREYELEDSVILTGRLDSVGVEREMLRASALAMSSHNEGFGYVIIEAMSCGLPVVAFDVRVGPGYIIENGVNGFLVSDGDEAEYAARLLALLDRDELRTAQAEKAMLRAKDFSKENIGKLWFDIIGD